MKQVLFWQATSEDFDEFKVCLTWKDRLRGLYFRPFNFICVLYPCKCIHTLFFFRRLDVAFLTKDQYVIRTIRNLRPWRIKYCRDAYFVIERFAHPGEEFYDVGEQVL